jgi:hypothetical protein
VDATVHLDKKTPQLCSGTPDCPGAETKLRLTQFTFAPDGHIKGARSIFSPLTPKRRWRAAP